MHRRIASLSTRSAVRFPEASSSSQTSSSYPARPALLPPCTCAHRPAGQVRSAHLWSAVASTSQHRDSLFFYPSFHHDLPPMEPAFLQRLFPNRHVRRKRASIRTKSRYTLPRLAGYYSNVGAANITSSSFSLHNLASSNLLTARSSSSSAALQPAAEHEHGLLFSARTTAGGHHQQSPLPTTFTKSNRRSRRKGLQENWQERQSSLSPEPEQLETQGLGTATENAAGPSNVAESVTEMARPRRRNNLIEYLQFTTSRVIDKTSAGQLEEARHIFFDFCNRVGGGKAHQRVRWHSQAHQREITHLLDMLVQAHVPYTDAVRRIEEIFEHFQAQISHNVRVRTRTWNALLRAYVSRSDAEGAFGVLERMKAEETKWRDVLGLEADDAHRGRSKGKGRQEHRTRPDGTKLPMFGPDVRTYTSLITLFAQRRDPESARLVFDAMTRGGITPSQHSYTSLMNAYTESGQWDDAVGLFDRLDDHAPGSALHPDVATCTVLLKCYVLMGAPVSDVLDLYRNFIYERGFKPTGHTFALIIQSACDAGLMDFAEEVFAKLDASFEVSTATTSSLAAQRKKESLQANVYHFSIMIRGFLRAGMREEAKKYYDEMVSRGIQPSSATWSMLITAYAQVGDQAVEGEMDSMPGTELIAESDGYANQVIQSLLNEYLGGYLRAGEEGDGKRRVSDDPAMTKGTALHSVFGPVITAYARAANVKLPRSAHEAAATAARAPTIHYTEENFDHFDPFYSAYSAYEEADEVSFPAQPDSLDSSTDIATAASESSAAQALQSFRDMLSLPSSKPSIPIYTALLDAYRRIGDLAGLEQIWTAAYNFALESTKVNYAARYLSISSDAEPISPSRRNILCLPLSIYIDALSSAHRHQDIAKLWLDMQQQGFGFDAGNWNSLVVALLRAGETERAFWTTETILLEPSEEDIEKGAVAASRQRASLQDYEGDPVDDASLDENVRGHVVVKDPEQEEREALVRATKAETPIRPPNRAHEQHTGEKQHLARYGQMPSLPIGKEEERVLLKQNRRQLASTDTATVPTLASAEPFSQDITEHQESEESEEDIEENNLDAISTSSMSVSPPLPLTSSYTFIRRRRELQHWAPYNATLRMLESALTRLDRLAGTESTLGDIEQADRARETAAKLREEYPRTQAAIHSYREKVNIYSSRVASRG